LFDLIATALKYRKVTLFLTFALVVYGLVSYQYIPKQEVPEFPVPAALVITVYPGASPLEVEELVTKKIEDEVRDVDGLEYVKSYSRNSVSIVVLRLEAAVSDTEHSWQQLRQRVADIEAELPEQCERPRIDTNLGETAGMLIGLSGEGYSYDQLTGFGREFIQALSKIDGIARFEIIGEVQREVKVEIDAERAFSYGLSMEEIFNILRMQNIEIPSGFLEKDGIKLNVNTPGAFESLKEIENTIVNVSRETGAVVRIKDLAKVSFEPERGASKIKQDGRDAVLLAGYFKKKKNIVLIGKEVREALEAIKDRMPPSLIIDEVLFQPENVDRKVTSFMNSLLQGVVLVILVVFIGMGFRNAIVVSTAIPVSVMLTFAFMHFSGTAVHSMSTMALIISLGMLVDNAIVIADAVQVRIDQGMGRVAAALDGVRDSAVPVFSATLTTVAAYAPLLFLPGSAGKFAEALPKVVIVALTASYLVAIFVTPALSSLIFRPLSESRRKPSMLRRAFQFMLEFGLRQRVVTVLIGVALLFGANWLRSQVGLSFFPAADKTYAHLVLRSELNDLDRTEAMVQQVGEILREQPEISMTTASVGEGLPKFYFTVGRASQQDNFGQILFHFDLTKSTRFKGINDLIYHLQSEINTRVTGVRVSVRALAVQGDNERPIAVRVSGRDLDRLVEVSRQVKALITSIPGTFDIEDDAAQQSLQLRVDVDQELASSAGLFKYDILRQINIALYGSEASVYRSAGKEYDIVVTSGIKTLEELENLSIKSRFGGGHRLLKQVASFRLEPQLDTVRRYNGARSVEVTAKSAPGFSPAVMEDVLEHQLLPTINTDGVTVTYNGERERIAKLFGSVLFAALIAVGVVYLILFIQFNSFLRPLVILVTVPLSSVGATVGLYVFRQDFSFTAVLGMASLVGIVVNNAILLIDYIDKARRRGDTVHQACLDAVAKRYRPIMLSTITTALGLTPLLVTYNPLFTPMAISLMNGLLFSTVLTMVMIPVVFSLFFSWEDKRKGLAVTGEG